MDRKIVTLEGEWTDSSFRDKSPRIINAGVPSFTERTPSLSHLHDQQYWKTLSSDLVTMDHRHWYFPDEDFLNYVKLVADLKPARLRIFDSPYGFEMPKMPHQLFEKLLISRTEMTARILRQNSPDTELLSPLARFIDAEKTNAFLRYFIATRNHFDALSIDICCDLADRSITQLASLVNQMRRISPKKAYVFLTVPSSENALVGDRSLSSDQWKPMRHRSAASKLRQIHQFIEQIFVGQTVWLVAGTCRDCYHPNRMPYQNFFYPAYLKEDVITDQWGPRSFCGLIDSDGRLKAEVLNAILALNS